MKASDFEMNPSLSFSQLVELIRQLPYREKLKLSELLKKETGQPEEEDRIETHLVSEKILAKDWLSPEEDEAWKDL